MEGANEQLCNTSFSRKLPSVAFRSVLVWGRAVFFMAEKAAEEEGFSNTLCPRIDRHWSMCLLLLSAYGDTSFVVSYLIKTSALELLSNSLFTQWFKDFYFSRGSEMLVWQMPSWLRNIRIKKCQVKGNQGVNKVKAIQCNVILVAADSVTCLALVTVVIEWGWTTVSVCKQTPHSSCEGCTTEGVWRPRPSCAQQGSSLVGRTWRGTRH